eukprot:Opistho-2@67766
MAVSAVPTSVTSMIGSSNSIQAISAVVGGTKYSKVVTDVAAPRWISRYSSELPPNVSASTDQAIAAAISPLQAMASVSSKASGKATSSAADSWIALALRTSQGCT